MYFYSVVKELILYNIVQKPQKNLTENIMGKDKKPATIIFP